MHEIKSRVPDLADQVKNETKIISIVIIEPQMWI